MIIDWLHMVIDSLHMVIDLLHMVIDSLLMVIDSLHMVIDSLHMVIDLLHMVDDSLHMVIEFRHSNIEKVNTHPIGSNQNINTMGECRSKIVRNRAFDCHLSPNWWQMAIENTENTVSSDFDPLRWFLRAFSIATYPVWNRLFWETSNYNCFSLSVYVESEIYLHYTVKFV